MRCGRGSRCARNNDAGGQGKPGSGEKYQRGLPACDVHRGTTLSPSLSLPHPPGSVPPMASYGKPLVFDMMELDMFDTVKKQLERLETGLTQALLSKKILGNER